MTDRASPSDWLEDIASLLPAVTLLQQIGYTYLTPEEALQTRGGKRSRVVLEKVLAEQLEKLNQIEYRGRKHDFSATNIQKAVEAISQFPYDALSTTSQTLYDLMTLGKSLEQTIEGDKKSYTLKYIDWQNPANNVFHVADEFVIERLGNTQTRRPDLVLFVNGIPLVAIECKRPDLRDAVDEAISQHLRNQYREEIPHFFCLTQLLLAVSQNAAKYGTTSTPKEFWAVWKEEAAEELEQELYALVNKPLMDEQKREMFAGRKSWQREKLEEIWVAGERQVSAQDRALYSLLRPERLLELIFGYIIFDAGDKKVARYQQYFAVKATLARVKQVRGDQTRQGGVIWHTTGSGKSLTMVMLAKALALDKTILNPKIILVNDRIDLDKQLKRTFKNCGAAVMQASSGKHLLKLVNLPKAEIITTVINKFETVAREKGKNESRDIFVLADESHRSQYGQTQAKMRNVFPNGCYIGFTGTPLLKKDKSTVQKFGGFIHSYSMPKAVADKAVVPLLYEGRDSEFKNTEAVDKWFERITHDLTDKQKADLKRKFKSAGPLYEAEARMKEIAYDIGVHFKPFKIRGLKGQFATSSKRAAIRYKKLLQELGQIRAEVIFSASDTREDHDSVDESDTPEVQGFWKDMMARYGTPENYQDSIIDKFKHGDGDDAPDILIVVDKLLTGFDVPRNAVLYIDKRLREHNILQAVARVNRIFKGKDYGLVIDYRGIFGEMNEALELYAALEREGFEREDIAGSLVDVSEEIAKLPTCYAALWDVFKEATNKRDIEAMRQWLYPQDRRDAFYEALRAFAMTLQLALSNPRFQEETSAETKQRYTQDLKYFVGLRKIVKEHYAESVDYSPYEAQIRSIVLTQIGAEDVKTIIEPVDIFEVDRFEEEIDRFEGDAAKADAIAARIKKVITEKMEEDPVLYLRLSELIQQAINDHRAKRLSDIEYLKQIKEHLDTARNKGASSVPAAVRNREQARAYYNVLKEKLDGRMDDTGVLANLATGIEDVIIQNKVRDWQNNYDAQNRMFNGIDDLVHDIKKAQDLSIPNDELDDIIGKIMTIAKHYEAN